MSKDKRVSLSETQLVDVWGLPIVDTLDEKSEPEQEGDEVPSYSRTLHVLGDEQPFVPHGRPFTF